MACITFACALVASSPLAAQTVPVVLITVRGAPENEGVPAVNRVASAIGPDASMGSALAGQLAARFGRRPIGGDPLEHVRLHAQSAMAQWRANSGSSNEATLAAFIDQADADAAQMESNAEALDRSPDNRDTLRRALIFVAERATAARDYARVERAMGRLARYDSTLVLTSGDASEAVRNAYSGAVTAMPRGTLAVDSVPPGCRIVRDGRAAGTAPVELQDLAEGEHRISVECGAVSSLLHPVQVAARTRATLVVDTQLDAFLAPEPTPALRYGTAAQSESRLVSDLASLGRALGSARVYGVLARGDRVRVIDVATASLAGESPVTDGSRLRTLMTDSLVTTSHPVAASPEPSSSPAPTPTVIALPSAPPAVVPPARHTERRLGPGFAAAVALGAVGALALGASGYLAYRADSDEGLALEVGRLPIDHASGRTHLENEAGDFRAAEWATLAGGGALVITGVLVGLFAGTHTETVQVAAMPTPGGASLLVGGSL